MAPLSPKNLFCEFLGTFLLVVSVIFIRLTGSPLWTGLAVASMQMVLLQSMGTMAIGIFNPAMSLALGVVRSLGGEGRPSWSEVLWLAAAQTVGAFSGALLATFSLAKELPVGDYLEYGLLSLGLSEWFYTFMICFVALNVTSPKRNDKEKLEFDAVAIGFAVLAGVYGAGNISGGIFNPALALALDVTSPSVGFHFSGAFMAVIQLLAAYTAALLYSKVRPEEFGTSATEGRRFERYISEFVGSLMVVLTAGLNFRTGTIIGPLSVCGAVTSMIFALEDVSGGHFNPALTLAQALTSGGQVATGHWAAQICGALAACGATMLVLVQHSAFGPKLPYDLAQATLCEAIFSFLLCLVFLSVTMPSTTKASQFSGLAIGSCFIAGGFAIRGVSGGALNPVIGLSLAVAGGGLRNALAYTAAQLLAAALAAAAFKVLHGDAKRDCVQ